MSPTAYLLCYTLCTVISMYVIRPAVMHECMFHLASLFSFIFLLFNYCCPQHPPFLTSNLPTLTSHIQSSPLPLSLSMGPLYMLLDKPCPPFPLLSPSTLPFRYCQFVLYFHVSGYILLAHLFCWLGSTYRWDRMVKINMYVLKCLFNHVILCCHLKICQDLSVRISFISILF